MNKNVQWLVDTYLLDNAEYESKQYFPDVVKSLGYECITTKYIPFSDDNEAFDKVDFRRPVIIYGTHNFVRQARRVRSLVPGDYCNEDNLKCSEWMPRYPANWLLNKDCQWKPWGWVMQMHIKHPIFIRPDSVGKLFGGRLIKPDEFGSEIEKIGSTSGVSISSMIIVNDPITINAEYRFFVAGGKVVSGSQYRRDGKLDIRIDCSSKAKSLADSVASYAWQPDSCYVVDIAEVDNGVKIIELNSMSCAGAYACDLTPLIEAVSQEAQKTWNDIMCVN